MRQQVINEPDETVGALFGNCTRCAHHVIDNIGQGTIWGYPEAASIGARIGECDVGGHDFAIIDGYLVDHWANDYLQKPWLYDLHSPADSRQVKFEYGDSSRWLMLDTCQRRFVPSAVDPLAALVTRTTAKLQPLYRSQFLPHVRDKHHLTRTAISSLTP